MKSFDAFCIGLFFGVAFILSIWMLADKGKDDWWRRELARRGHAEFVVDQGARLQWRWKDGVEK